MRARHGSNRRSSRAWCWTYVYWLILGLTVVEGVTPPAPASSKNKTSSTSGPRARRARDPYLGAIVVDATTGRILFQDQADVEAIPASTLKLMDLLIILEKVKAGELRLDDSVPVSARAANTGGTQVWLKQGEVFTMDDMLYALMIQSANDAAVALAERVAGTVDGFVALMNARAKSLGMTRTVFRSVHGLPPGPGQEFDVTTPRDFARLCRELVKYPEAFRYTSARQRTFRPNAAQPVIMRSHNHLLQNVSGCDGLKTGYIFAAGFSIAATAARNGDRVIAVVMDCVNAKVRDAKAGELISTGFAALAHPAPPGTRHGTP